MGWIHDPVAIFGDLKLFSECEPPKNGTASEMCLYLTNNCPDLSYLYQRQYYCMNVDYPIMSNVLLWVTNSILTGLLFLILGLLASDYLVPNLSSLSDLLKLNEKLSGLTLLAFANGSPDVLSTYIAMKQGMTSMAVGELLGSANFALTVVIGVLAIYKPFRVNETTFMRDLIVFFLLMVVSLFILFDGKISVSESITLCILYIVFIVLNFLFTDDDGNEIIEGYDKNNTDNKCPMNVGDDCLNPSPIGETLSDRPENSSTNSMASNESNTSVNDYYFAHNVDNLERGRGYKIALIDSLRLAWLWKRKEIKNIPLHSQSININTDIENQSEADELTPLHSPSSQQIKITQHVSKDDEEDINKLDEPLQLKTDTDKKKSEIHKCAIEDSTANSLNDRTIYSSASLGLNRTNSTKKIRNKDEYQILYPCKAYDPSRNNSLINIKQYFQNQDKPTSSTPPLSDVEPFRGKFQIIEENDVGSLASEVHRVGARESMSEGYLSPHSYTKNITGNDDTMTCSRSPSPMIRANPPSLTLIPYVEYTKNSMFTKLCPLQIYTSSLAPHETILSFLIIPLSSILNLIVPVPLPSELQGDILKHELEISTNLFHIQIGVFPLILFDFDMSFTVIAAAITLPLLSILFKKVVPSIYQISFTPVSSVVGFFVVLKLITLTAAGIIAILKDIAEIYSLNESILGLTVLSLGNSIGDVVTNLALAGLGRPLTGLHACFGSPLLYILFGIGACSLIIQLSNNHNSYIEFTVDGSLQLTALSIIMMLFFYSVMIPFNGWMFKRWMGFVGVALWFILTIANFVINGHKGI